MGNIVPVPFHIYVDRDRLAPPAWDRIRRGCGKHGWNPAVPQRVTQLGSRLQSQKSDVRLSRCPVRAPIMLPTGCRGFPRRHVFGSHRLIVLIPPRVGAVFQRADLPDRPVPNGGVREMRTRRFARYQPSAELASPRAGRGPLSCFRGLPSQETTGRFVADRLKVRALISVFWSRQKCRWMPSSLS